MACFVLTCTRTIKRQVCLSLNQVSSYTLGLRLAGWAKGLKTQFFQGFKWDRICKMVSQNSFLFYWNRIICTDWWQKMLNSFQIKPNLYPKYHPNSVRHSDPTCWILNLHFTPTGLIWSLQNVRRFVWASELKPVGTWNPHRLGFPFATQCLVECCYPIILMCYFSIYSRVWSLPALCEGDEEQQWEREEDGRVDCIIDTDREKSALISSALVSSSLAAWVEGK